MALQLILASASPRRREILTAAGIPFEAQPSQVEERPLPGETAGRFVARLAVEKAEDVAARLHGGLVGRFVLGADTAVVIDGRILGKPESDAEAAEMLRALSGRDHIVLTGLCLLETGTGRRRVEVESTTVTFAPLDEAEIRDYVAAGEPRDKAGAYAIQGRAGKFVTRIEGCYFNVMGLPVAALYRMLQEMRA